MKKTDIPIFMRGVFWTLFVGMALWIAFDISDKVIPNETGYTVAQNDAMALKVEQVIGKNDQHMVENGQ